MREIGIIAYIGHISLTDRILHEMITMRHTELIIIVDLQERKENLEEKTPLVMLIKNYRESPSEFELKILTSQPQRYKYDKVKNHAKTNSKPRAYYFTRRKCP